MTTILVTGGYGFIGRYLCSYLSRLGNEIISIGHGNWNKKDSFNCGIKNWMNCDITFENLQTVFKKKKPQIIFHLAGGATVSNGEKNPEQDFFKNVISTSELLEWIRLESSKSKLIVASSASVYGQGINGTISEDFIGNPYSVYGKNKNKVELLCKLYKEKYDLNYIIVRLFSVYGPQLKKQLLWEFCNRLISNEIPIILGGTGKEVRDWVYIDDVVKVLSSIGLNDQKIAENNIINIGTGIGHNVQDIIKIILYHWNKKENLYNKDNIKFSGKNRPGDPFSLVADISFLSKLDLFCKTDPTEGIGHYIDWFKDLKNCK
jgi:UDP-glucose 4-epimerase